MKPGRLIPILLFFAANFLVAETNAQRLVTEASLTYKISIESIETGQSAPKPMGDATLSVLIKGNLSRTDMVSNLGNESTIFDNKTGKGAILREYSGQKLMITMNNDNWLQKNQVFRNLPFKTDNAEQMIAGFTSKKAVGKMEDGKDITVFYLPETQLQNLQYNNAFARLPGIPVQYQLESGNIRFTYVLASAQFDPVPSARFELPKSGYRVMSYEESQQLRKSGN